MREILGQDGVDSSQLFVDGQNISFLRKTIIICIFAYSLFGVLDYMLYPEHLDLFYIIRFCIVCPYLIILYCFSYTRLFLKVKELMLILLYFLAGGGIVVMIYIIDGNNYYTNGLFLVFGIGFYLIRMKFFSSIIAFTLVVTFFMMIELYGNRMSVEEVFVNVVFYFSYALIGIFGSFFNTKYVRAQYQFENDAIKKRTTLEMKINKQLQKINLQLAEINIAHEETICSIAKLAESRDKLTGDHVKRVGELCYILADALSEDIYTKNNADKNLMKKYIRLSSILHDVGKISISDSILNKQGRLTEDEFNIMKTHTIIGAETLKSIGEESLKNDFVIQGIDIARYHHERWDGTGYPTGISGRDIPLSARIVAIIDVFDALISERSYKSKFSKAKSLSIIEEGMGSHFDPELVSVFIQVAKNSDDVDLFWK